MMMAEAGDGMICYATVVEATTTMELRWAEMVGHRAPGGSRVCPGDAHVVVSVVGVGTEHCRCWRC